MTEEQIVEYAKIEHYRSICREALMYISKLGGPQALDAFERAIGVTHQPNTTDRNLVEGMTKALELMEQDFRNVRTSPVRIRPV